MPIHDPDDPLPMAAGINRATSKAKLWRPRKTASAIAAPRNTVDFSQGKATIPVDVLWALSRSPTLFARSSGRRLR
jgi:hypothetical protein